MFGAVLLAIHKVRGAKAWEAANQVFTGQSIPDYKNLVRMHFAPDGSLTLYPLGVDRVGREWDYTPDRAPGAEVHPARRGAGRARDRRAAALRRAAGAGSPNAVRAAIIWRVRRAAALWLVLFAAYAATIGLPAFGDSQFAGDEPHYLLTAESIVSDRDLDVRDEYATRAYRDWYPYLLERRGRLTGGQANEPTGAGFALLIAPAYAIGGPTAVQLLLAAIAALAFVLGAALARRIVPEPWASGAALACGLSPPALAYATTVTPELTAGALLTVGGAVGAEDPRAAAHPLGRGRRAGARRAALAGPAVRRRRARRSRWRCCAGCKRRARGFALLVEIEVLLFSGVMFVTINDQLYGGFTPAAAALPGDRLGDLSAADFVDRGPRLVGLWLDRTYGVLAWAPVVALAFYALWLLWRSHRDHIARLLPERADVEVAALLCGAGVRRAGVRRDVHRADDVRLLLPRPLPRRGAAGLRRARRLGPAPRAARGPRARGRDARDERLVVRRPADRRRHDRRAGRAHAARPARRRAAAVRHRFGRG